MDQELKNTRDVDVPSWPVRPCRSRLRTGPGSIFSVGCRSRSKTTDSAILTDSMRCSRTVTPFTVLAPHVSCLSSIWLLVCTCVTPRRHLLAISGSAMFAYASRHLKQCSYSSRVSSTSKSQYHFVPAAPRSIQRCSRRGRASLKACF